MSDWYERNAERYERIDPGLAGDIEFYVELARSVEPPVLELGCGTGRVALAIARAGVPVVGLDRSPAMLAIARRRSWGLVGMTWVEEDMRAFDLAAAQPFGMICIPYRGFQHLLADADQRATLSAVRRHLRPGGTFALDLMNPARTAMDTLASGQARGGRPAKEAEGPRRSSLYRGRPLCFIDVPVMRGLLEATGFAVDQLYGWFDRQPYHPTSDAQVWVSHRGGD